MLYPQQIFLKKVKFFLTRFLVFFSKKVINPYVPLLNDPETPSEAYARFEFGWDALSSPNFLNAIMSFVGSENRCFKIRVTIDAW